MKTSSKAAIIVSSLIVVAVLGMGAFVFATSAKSEPAPAPVLSKYETGPPDAQEMLELVNAERAKIGVAPLVMNTNIERVSQLKANDFSDRNYYSHDILGTDKNVTPEMNAILVKSCTTGSENIGKNFDTSKNAIDAWVASKGHYEAMTNPNFTSTGFGVSEIGNGYYYGVEHFCVAK